VSGQSAVMARVAVAPGRKVPEQKRELRGPNSLHRQRKRKRLLRFLPRPRLPPKQR